MPDSCSAPGSHEGTLHEWTIKIGKESRKFILCKKHEKAQVLQESELSDQDCACRICVNKRMVS